MFWKTNLYAAFIFIVFEDSPATRIGIIIIHQDKHGETPCITQGHDVRGRWQSGYFGINSVRLTSVPEPDTGTVGRICPARLTGTSIHIQSVYRWRWYRKYFALIQVIAVIKIKGFVSISVFLSMFIWKLWNFQLYLNAHTRIAYNMQLF